MYPPSCFDHRQLCAQTCSELDSAYFGTQFGTECWCAQDEDEDYSRCDERREQLVPGRVSVVSRSASVVLRSRISQEARWLGG